VFWAEQCPTEGVACLAGVCQVRFSTLFARSARGWGYSCYTLLLRRYELPTNLQPTLTLSTPSSLLNTLLPHLLSLSQQLVHLRLLNPGESPSSQTFVASAYVSAGVRDQLAECAGAMIAQMGRMRRTGMGWEDKVGFLEFYRGRTRGEKKRQ